MQAKDLRSKQIKKEALNLKSEHKPHDPKKTSDITESAYTDRDIEWLRSDLENMV